MKLGQTLLENQKLREAQEQEFQEIINRNPILHSCVNFYRLGELSEIEALKLAIRFLILQNDNLIDTVVRYVGRYGKDELENENA